MSRRIGILAIAAALVFAAACSKKEGSSKHMEMGEFVEAQDSFPHVRYFDSGLVSINDRCPVRKTRLNPRMPAVYVNGQPVGFC